jgi:hypothetical protein
MRSEKMMRRSNAANILCLNIPLASGNGILVVFSQAALENLTRQNLGERSALALRCLIV